MLHAARPGWTRVRLLVRIATGLNEAALIESAAAMPLRELEEFVRGYARRAHVPARCDPRGDEDAPEKSDADHDPHDPEVRRSVTVSRSGRRMWRCACELASRSAGSVPSPGQVLELAAAEAMSGAPPQSAGRSPLPRWAPSFQDHEQRLRDDLRAREQRGRRSLLGFLAETGVAEGFPWLADATVDAGPARAMDALLEWAATPRHRDPVFERDGWRCSVPACSSRRNPHDHHVLFRSHGGDNHRDNRTTVCAAHHLHGIHAGVVRARGRAPAGIVWELGCRPARGRPLMRLHGDRIL